MLIRDLEFKTGLERATIRFYEREGLITPTRAENGYREYSENDVQTLLKIKLLRQLGMSLERIKSLQQGSEDFADALNEQICTLDQEIQNKSRAREVCVQIRDDGVSFTHLDAQRYLNELTRPSGANTGWKPKPVPEFSEHLRRERHPVKRYIARYLDEQFLSLPIQLLVFVFLRLRFQNDYVDNLITWACLFLSVPINALWLHHTGTTPGKWLLGIRVESVNGGRLSLQEALEREWNVLRYGRGFGIPIWSLWRLYRSWKEDRDEGGNSWNLDWDQSCEETGWRRGLALAAAFVLVFAESGWIAVDSIKPRYLGSELTVSQFAENYNYFMKITQDDVSYASQLNSRGEWNGGEVSGVVVYFGGTPEDPYRNFEYTTTEDGYIRSITYENSWTDVWLTQPMDGVCLEAASTILFSRKGFSIYDLNEFMQWYTAKTNQDSGLITYENIEIEWNIECENCELSAQYGYGDGCTYNEIDDTLTSRLTLWCEIRILQQ